MFWQLKEIMCHWGNSDLDDGSGGRCRGLLLVPLVGVVSLEDGCALVVEVAALHVDVRVQVAPEDGLRQVGQVQLVGPWEEIHFWFVTLYTVTSGVWLISYRVTGQVGKNLPLTEF